MARKARKALKAASDAGVDLVLCGHLHVSHIHPLETEPGKHRLVIASAGTATSSRGRETSRGTNFYNLIHVSQADFEIEERRYDLERGCFAENDRVRFKRQTEGVEAGKRAEA